MSAFGSIFGLPQWGSVWGAFPDPLPPPSTDYRDSTHLPQQFTNAATMLDQSNVVGIMLFRNGVMQTETFDYVRSGGIISMVAAPHPGDILTVRVVAIGLQLGGLPTRYIAPWTLRLAGPFDGVSTTYLIDAGATIFGVCDGVNPLFTWGVWVQRPVIWRNGVRQTEGVDVATAPTAVKFLPGSIPHPGDIITMMAYWE